MYQKIVTALTLGAIFIASFVVSSAGPAFAGDPVPGLDITIEQIPGGKVSTKNYNSSLSNKSIAKVREEVGNIFLRYGVGGADINKVTDALEGSGVYEAELKSFLIEIGIGEEGVNEIFTKLDELGIGINGENESTARKSSRRVRYGNITLEREVFQDASKNIIQNIRSAAPEERENLKEKLKASRETFQTEILSMSLSIRENAKVLRENFRENVRTAIGHVDHGKTARIAVAHGKGLRMINRFRSATARFDHILGRLESRVEKLKARNIDMSLVIPIIEEAKNMQVENEAKLEDLKAKYEALLADENPRGIAGEARAIAKELKTEIENIHAKLREIATTIRDNIAINEKGPQ
tara:strand:- start:3917 stop:4975 length:1059 start_codon:yes stop_codon:yes gene_type:complete